MDSTGLSAGRPRKQPLGSAVTGAACKSPRSLDSPHVLTAFLLFGHRRECTSGELFLRRCNFGLMPSDAERFRFLDQFKLTASWDDEGYTLFWREKSVPWQYGRLDVNLEAKDAMAHSPSELRHGIEERPSRGFGLLGRPAVGANDRQMLSAAGRCHASNCSDQAGALTKSGLGAGERTPRTDTTDQSGTKEKKTAAPKRCGAII